MQDYASIKEKFYSLEKKVTQLSQRGDFDSLKPLLSEYNRLKEIVKKIEQLEDARRYLRELEEMLEEDPSLRDEIEEEIESTRGNIESLEKEIRRLLIPRDPNYDSNVILEIRAGAGGEEAALFAADLLRMYMKYAEKQGWKVSITHAHETDLGGYKEVVLLIEGKGAYGKLKYEGGVHRVQRIPITETGGRIHTSTVSVVVMPEYQDTSDVEINPDDLKIETMRASGAGGQHVNKTESAVRITHVPTGIVVHVQDERSQHQNKAKALRILKSKLKELKEREKREKLGQIRRSMVGSMERSEKIRTYNWPQNRVTDHRLSGEEKNYSLEKIMEGDLDELLENLEKLAISELEKEMAEAESPSD